MMYLYVFELNFVSILRLVRMNLCTFMQYVHVSSSASAVEACKLHHFFYECKSKFPAVPPKVIVAMRYATDVNSL